MGFFRTNWLILGAGLTLESLWQYFLSTLPHLEEVPLGLGLKAEIPIHGWNAVCLAVGGWVELPALLIVMPLKNGSLRASVLFALTWATWVLVLLLARRVLRFTHRIISSA
jgi:hypothetical protein